MRTSHSGLKAELRLTGWRSDCQPSQPMPASFNLVTVRDIDGDGQKEVLASYDTNRAGREFQRVPVVISRQPAEERYIVTPLLAIRSLGRAASAGLPTYGFGQAGRRGALSVWVSDLALDPGRLFLAGHATLATSVVLPEGDPQHLSLGVEPAARGGGQAYVIPRHVRFWRLDLQHTRPRALPLCVQHPTETGVRVSARSPDATAFLGRPLADAMSTAQIGLGDFLDGRCTDPPAS